MKRFALSTSSILAALLLAACGSSAAPPSGVADGGASLADAGSPPTDGGAIGGNRCVPNESRACACVDGGTGQQVCRADGTYSACARGGAVCAQDVTAPVDAGVDADGGLLPCATGEKQACACIGSRVGERVCTAGTWSACMILNENCEPAILGDGGYDGDAGVGYIEASLRYVGSDGGLYTCQQLQAVTVESIAVMTRTAIYLGGIVHRDGCNPSAWRFAIRPGSYVLISTPSQEGPCGWEGSKGVTVRDGETITPEVSVRLRSPGCPFPGP